MGKEWLVVRSAGGYIPHSHGLVPAGGGQQSPVGAKRSFQDELGAPSAGVRSACRGCGG